MNICSGGRNKHDEIVFEGIECPLCISQSELDDVSAELAEVREELGVALQNQKD